MQIGEDHIFHLTYCSEIHPGNGWEEVFSNIRTYAPALRERLSPEKPFALGLRLSAAESERLLSGVHLMELKAFLVDNGLYVFTLNGFPYGAFHGQLIKSQMFAPDWQDEKRVRYTLSLIEILKLLLPEGMEGSISTMPLSYKPWISKGNAEVMERITRNLVRVAAILIQVKKEDNKLIHVDIEPEPDGLVENTDEIVRFYNTWLLPAGAPLLAESANISVSEARRHLLEHIQICLDTCHMAVEYENPSAALDSLSANGIRVGKVQITSGLKVLVPDDEQRRTLLAEQLRVFTESPYLHQVIVRRDAGIQYQFRDLGDALPLIGTLTASRWRIHFHVPLFVDRYYMLSSTHDDTHAVLRLLRERGFSRYLEIETYTWNVLPPGLKEDLLDLLQHEYQWVLGALGFETGSGTKRLNG